MDEIQALINVDPDSIDLDASEPLSLEQQHQILFGFRGDSVVNDTLDPTSRAVYAVAGPIAKAGIAIGLIIGIVGAVVGTAIVGGLVYCILKG